MKMDKILLNMIANIKVAKPIYAETFLYATPVTTREQLYAYKENFMRHVKVDRMRKVHVSSHAVERWNERIGPYSTREQLHRIFQTIIETQHRRLKNLGDNIWCLDNDIIFAAKRQKQFELITFYGRISYRPALKNVHDVRSYKQKCQDGLNLKLTEQELANAQLPILPKMRTYIRGTTTIYLLEHFDIVGEELPAILCSTYNEVTRKHDSYVIDLTKPTERVLHRKVLNLLYQWRYYDFLYTYYETFDEAQIEKAARRIEKKVQDRERRMRNTNRMTHC